MADEDSEDLLRRTLESVRQHLLLYLSTGGREGHIRDFTGVGARGLLPTLVLETVGRKSGNKVYAPLIYGVWGGDWVVVGSKGGAPEHPHWYLNLQGQKEVGFQVATQAFRGTWRSPEGAERAQVWKYMAHLYPPYDQYQEWAGDRQIPLVMLTPVEEIALFAPPVS